MGFNIAILNYNIIKFFKYFQLNIKIIIRKELKLKFFKKKKKFKKNSIYETLKFSDIKNIFKPSKNKIKTKKEKEEEKKKIFKNENFLLAERLIILKQFQLDLIEKNKIKKLKKPFKTKSFFISKKLFLLNKLNKKKKIHKKSFFFKKKKKFFKKNYNSKKKNYIFFNLKTFKENDLFLKFFLICKKKNKKQRDLRSFFGYLKQLSKISLNFFYLKKIELKKKKKKNLFNFFFFLKRRMIILKKLQKKEFVLQTIFINRLKKNNFQNVNYINNFNNNYNNNTIFFNKFYSSKKIYFLNKNNNFLNFFFFSFIKNFIIFFLNNIFFHNKIIINFFNQNEFFNSTESLVNFLRMRIQQKYQVSHILNLLFNNLKKKKSIIGIELGLFGRYQKKLRNRNI